MAKYLSELELQLAASKEVSLGEGSYGSVYLCQDAAVKLGVGLEQEARAHATIWYRLVEMKATKYFAKPFRHLQQTCDPTKFMALYPRVSALIMQKVKKYAKMDPNASVTFAPCAQVFVMAFHPGYVPFTTFLYKMRKTLADRKILTRIRRQIAEALLCLHKAGFAHTDIHSHNVLVKTDPPQIKIIDFGLAQPLYMHYAFGHYIKNGYIEKRHDNIALVMNRADAVPNPTHFRQAYGVQVAGHYEKLARKHKHSNGMSMLRHLTRNAAARAIGRAYRARRVRRATAVPVPVSTAQSRQSKKTQDTNH
jgi:serine/threonine protein kinase